MGAPGVDGGWVFSATLTNELIEPVAEVLHLARSQDATHSHQLGVVGVVVTTSRSRMGVATRSQHPPLDLCRLSGSLPRQASQGRSHSRSWSVSQETRQPFWGPAGGRGGDGNVSLASWHRVFVLSLVRTHIEQVQPEEKREIRWKIVLEAKHIRNACVTTEIRWSGAVFNEKRKNGGECWCGQTRKHKFKIRP